MARLRFIRGVIRGRLGEFVGSSWKGIPYIKTFTPPSNPKTPEQLKVRAVFKAVSIWAQALFHLGLYAFIPSAAKKSERNSVFVANRQMFTNKEFVGEDLQVAPSNFALIGVTTECNTVGQNYVLTFKAPNLNGMRSLKLVTVFYNFAEGRVGYCKTQAYDNLSTNSLNATLSIPIAEVANDDMLADVNVFSFVSSVNEKGELLLSKTFSTPISS